MGRVLRGPSKSTHDRDGSLMTPPVSLSVRSVVCRPVTVRVEGEDGVCPSGGTDGVLPPRKGVRTLGRVRSTVTVDTLVRGLVVLTSWLQGTGTSGARKRVVTICLTD